MRTKMYSTRLHFGDVTDEEVMAILDKIDENEDDPGTWLREAARQRHLTESTPQEEILEESVHQEDEQDVSETQRLTYVPDSEHPELDRSVLQLLDSLSEAEQVIWIQKAIQMRYLIEQDAPAYFIQQWDNRRIVQPIVPELSEGSEQASDDTEVSQKVLSGVANSVAGNGLPSVLDDGFDWYRYVLPDLLRLEVMMRD